MLSYIPGSRHSIGSRTRDDWCDQTGVTPRCRISDGHREDGLDPPRSTARRRDGVRRRRPGPRSADREMAVTSTQADPGPIGLIAIDVVEVVDRSGHVLLTACLGERGDAPVGNRHHDHSCRITTGEADGALQEGGEFGAVLVGIEAPELVVDPDEQRDEVEGPDGSATIDGLRPTRRWSTRCWRRCPPVAVIRSVGECRGHLLRPAIPPGTLSPMVYESPSARKRCGVTGDHSPGATACHHRSPAPATSEAAVTHSPPSASRPPHPRHRRTRHVQRGEPKAHQIGRR